MTNVVTALLVDAADRRSLTPARQHAGASQPVNQLSPGASSIPVDDHDEKLLYYQLEAEQLLLALRWLTGGIVAVGEGPNRPEGPFASIASTSS